MGYSSNLNELEKWRWTRKAGLHVRRKHKHKHKHKPRVNRDDANTSFFFYLRRPGSHVAYARAYACACVVRVTPPALDVTCPCPCHALAQVPPRRVKSESLERVTHFRTQMQFSLLLYLHPLDLKTWPRKIRACTRVGIWTRSDCYIKMATNADHRKWHQDIVSPEIGSAFTFLSSTITVSWQARGAKQWVGSGNSGSFSPGAAARIMALPHEKASKNRSLLQWYTHNVIFLTIGARVERARYHRLQKNYLSDRPLNWPASCLRHTVGSRL